MSPTDLADHAMDESSVAFSNQLPDETVASAEHRVLSQRDTPFDAPASDRGRFFAPNKLWNKRDADYDIDLSLADRILERFAHHVDVLKGGGAYERDFAEDAFYYNYRDASVHDIETIRSSHELLDRVSSRRLREMSLQLVDYCMKINRDAEALIDLETGIPTPFEQEVRRLLKASVLRKKRILQLIHRVRNYIGEIILTGEECHRHVEESCAIAFRGISSLETHARKDNL